MGAVILERHFIDSKDVVGPDIQNSMTPNELRDLKKMSYEMFLMRGGSKQDDISQEDDTRNFAFATVVSVRDLPSGHILSFDDLLPKRPRSGDFEASEINSLVGRRLSQPIAADTHFKSFHFE